MQNGSFSDWWCWTGSIWDLTFSVLDANCKAWFLMVHGVEMDRSETWPSLSWMPISKLGFSWSMVLKWIDLRLDLLCLGLDFLCLGYQLQSLVSHGPWCWNGSIWDLTFFVLDLTFFVLDTNCKAWFSFSLVSKWIDLMLNIPCLGCQFKDYKKKRTFLIIRCATFDVWSCWVDHKLVLGAVLYLHIAQYMLSVLRCYAVNLLMHEVCWVGACCFFLKHVSNNAVC